MKPLLHKPSFLLLLITGAIPVLSSLLFTIGQLEIRREMKQKLRNEQLVSFSIRDQDIQWIEKGKEIMIQGRLFDIRSARTESGVTTFTGLFDDKETGLTGLLQPQHKHGAARPDKALIHFFSKLQSLYHETVPAVPMQRLAYCWPPLWNSSTPPFGFGYVIEQPPRA